MWSYRLEIDSATVATNAVEVEVNVEVKVEVGVNVDVGVEVGLEKCEVSRWTSMPPGEMNTSNGCITCLNWHGRQVERGSRSASGDAKGRGARAAEGVDRKGAFMLRCFYRMLRW